MGPNFEMNQILMELNFQRVKFLMGPFLITYKMNTDFP